MVFTKMMKRAVHTFSVLIWAVPLFAASGGGEGPIVFVADSRGLTGWRAWVTNLYNENLFYFAVLTVIVIPALAIVLGSITNFFLSRSGINLRSRVLSEH